MKEKLKTALIGIVGTLIALGAIKSFIGLPFEGAFLYYTGEHVSGNLLNVEQFVEGTESGTKRSYSYTYEYEVNGTRIEKTKQRMGKAKGTYLEVEKPIEVSVVYSSTIPRISRLSDGEEMSFFQLVIKESILLVCLYVFILWAGIYCTWEAMGKSLFPINSKESRLQKILFLAPAYLFLFGGIGGWIVYHITDIKWISVFAYLSVLPIVIWLVYYFTKDNENIKLRGVLIAVVVTVSVVSAVYVVDQGDLGVIPEIAISVIGAACGVLVLMFFWALSTVYFDKWWSKSLVFIGTIAAIIAVYMNRPIVIKIECEQLSTVAHLDIFEGLTPPISKKAILAKQKTLTGISTEIQQKDMSDSDVENEELFLIYLRDTGTLEVVFEDQEYEDGYLRYFPTNIIVEEFLKDSSALKETYRKKYRIRFKSQEEEILSIRATKENKITEVEYYSD